MIVKVDALVPVPEGVVTEMVPVAVAAGMAVILVALTTLKEAAFTPPNLTAVAPVNPVPVMVTEVTFAQPLDGVKEVIVGATGGVNKYAVPLPGQVALASFATVVLIVPPPVVAVTLSYAAAELAIPIEPEPATKLVPVV